MRVVRQPTVRAVFESKWMGASKAVREGYQSLCAGNATNPPSSFLRIPEGNRSIALTACLHDRVFGVKWISSFPENIHNALPRANGLIVLNDIATGVPTAILDGSLISAYRTTSLALDFLRCTNGWHKPLGLVGAGNINRKLVDLLRLNGFTEAIFVSDTDYSRAERFRGAVPRHSEWILDNCPVVSFATTSTRPWALPRGNDNQIFLHLSLRDIAPEFLENAQNVVDDKEAAASEGTSLSFVSSDAKNRVVLLHDLLAGLRTTTSAAPVVYSPFGLGVLDIALAQFVIDNVEADQELDLLNCS